MSTSAEIEAASVTQTKRRALGRLSSLVSVTATLACGALLMSPAVAHADQPAITGEPAAYCPDVQVVFARGTGEAPGAGRVGEAFVDSLRAMLTGKSVAVYGVEYPASYDFLRAMDGVSDAGVFISNMAESCPQTKNGPGRLLAGCRSRGYPRRDGPDGPRIHKSLAGDSR